MYIFFNALKTYLRMYVKYLQLAALSGVNILFNGLIRFLVTWCSFQTETMLLIFCTEHTPILRWNTCPLCEQGLKRDTFFPP